MRIKPKVRLNPIEEPGKGKTGRVNENESLIRPRHALVTENKD
jgi:hypothetical protein